MKPVILFRSDLNVLSEMEMCQEYFPTYEFRSAVPDGSLVIGRYSVLPFYREVEREMESKGCRLINTYSEHSYIADVTAWACGDLEGMTPRTWTEWHALPKGKSFVVKGKTNSRKHLWNTCMFALTRDDVPAIAGRLLQDALIGQQGLVVREFVPLKRLGEGLNGLPISNEFRTFWYKRKWLGGGFYWASHPELAAAASWTTKAAEFAQQAADRVSEWASFFVLDIAETENGDWIVVEVNDGQMSGMSLVPPSLLYGALSDILMVQT